MKMYRWYSASEDGISTNKSYYTFDTMKDCYNDMRDYAILLMCWNTQFDDDFEDNVAIGYRALFQKDRILLSSYSGRYCLKILPVDYVDNDEDVYNLLMKECQEIEIM